MQINCAIIIPIKAPANRSLRKCSLRITRVKDKKDAKKNDISKHFIAVSTNLEKIYEFGIDKENIFPMKDWVGGRFSLWSSVGLIICLAIGPIQFKELLEGAGKMDYHFRNSPFEKNIPVVLGLISVWYNNFWGSESQAIIPYTQYLRNLPAYLQQAFMESNGKIVGRDGNLVNYQTGSIIWGASGTNAQHAFFQHIHQGTKLIPVDFIGFKNSLFNNIPLLSTSNNKTLLAINFFLPSLNSFVFDDFLSK